MKPVICTFLFIFQCISAWAWHPTHMSVVNMDINAETLEISYTIRIFQDDFNYLLTNLYHEELFHSTDTFDLNQHTEKIDNYFLNNFKLSADNINQTPVLVKKDIQQTEYNLYYIIKLNSIPEMLQIDNSLFLDQHSDQTNLVIFSFKNKEKGLTFDNNNQTQNIYLDKN